VLPAARPVGGKSALSGHIVAIARGGDRSAFAALFIHFAPRIKTYLTRLGANPAVADDLAQETLLTVWRKAAQFDPAKAEASTWVFTIARNLRIDALRRENFPVAGDDDLAQLPDPSDSAETILDMAARGRRLREALADLPPEQAEIVQLSFFQDKPHSAIESELGIPLGTVKSRLRLAMKRLRGALGRDLFGELP